MSKQQNLSMLDQQIRNESREIKDLCSLLDRETLSTPEQLDNLAAIAKEIEKKAIILSQNTQNALKEIKQT